MTRPTAPERLLDWMEKDRFNVWQIAGFVTGVIIAHFVTGS